MHRLLGLDVPDDAHGVLQDVHWGAGLIGYFPTYTLGNLMAAQLWEALRADLPDARRAARARRLRPAAGVARASTCTSTVASSRPPSSCTGSPGRSWPSRRSCDYLRAKLADAGLLTAAPRPGS